MFSTVLQELGRVIGMSDLAPDESGALTLTVDGVPFTLQYYEGGEEIYIIHRIGSLPEDARTLEVAQRFLLESNCFFRAVGPGTLGVEENDIFYTVRVACCDKSGIRLSGHELEHLLRSVVDTCTQLRNDCTEVIEKEQNHDKPSDLEYLSMLKV